MTQQSQIIEELEAKTQGYKKREKQIKEELRNEMERRIHAESGLEALKKKLEES